MSPPPSDTSGDPPASGGQGYSGVQDLTSGNHEFNAADFQIFRFLQKSYFMTLVQVMAVTPIADDGTGGSVDVQPLINQVDGDGNPVPHGELYSLPYFRLQGGGNAAIIDPVVKDIGAAFFADRDISQVVKTRAQANPGSARIHSMSDGIYMGGWLNGAVTQFVRIAAEGIRLKSPTKVFIDAPEAETTGNLTVDGNLTVTGNTSLGGGGKKVVLDGDPVSGGSVHATSTKTTAT